MKDEAGAQNAGMALQGNVWMTVDGQKLGGRERMDLLAAIAEHGSITAAAKAVGLSYKGAWDAIEAMNNLAGEALLERLAGGKGGGGTRLTARGQQLVKNFAQIDEAHRRFVAALSSQSHALADDLLMIRNITMKTSARNQFSGKVVSVQQGVVNDEVTLGLAGGQQIVATITRDSSESLALAPGVSAWALIKASSIIVVTEPEGARFSARNQLSGTVSRVQEGAVNTEVSIALAGGATIAAIVTRESAIALELTVGKPATAIFKASAVILGT
ncbi:TOBE domain-containing protein [Pseudoduganella danionis]|nr:TOBE domain-containing protein [Pseudoduganella danionis]